MSPRCASEAGARRPRLGSRADPRPGCHGQHGWSAGAQPPLRLEEGAGQARSPLSGSPKAEGWSPWAASIALLSQQTRERRMRVDSCMCWVILGLAGKFQVALTERRTCGGHHMGGFLHQGPRDNTDIPSVMVHGSMCSLLCCTTDVGQCRAWAEDSEEYWESSDGLCWWIDPLCLLRDPTFNTDTNCYYFHIWVVT